MDIAKILLPLCFIASFAKAQIRKAGHLGSITQTGKYLSLNPFALAEPHITVGLGFGNRFSARSEYFTELGYNGKSPFYKDIVDKMNGFRLITQYRYHFLQQWKPLLGLEMHRNRGDYNPFVSVEFRLKQYSFSYKHSFVNEVSTDTLKNFSYNASASVYGGALLFGQSYNLSADKNWKLEVTVGIGGRQKIVRFKNLPAGYKPVEIRAIDIKPPAIYETTGLPYFPIALRVVHFFD
jgi:hypothetical protein